MATRPARIDGMLRLLLVLLLASAGGMPAPARAHAAAPAIEAQGFVRSVGERAIALLARYNATGDVRSRGELKQLLRKSCDLEAQSRFVIGRHWGEASEIQRAELLALLPEYAVETVTRMVFAWHARVIREFAVARGRALGNGDMLVETRIRLGQGEPITVGWQVHRGARNLKIVDATFLGMSLRMTLRDVVDGQISQNGVDGFIANIRHKLAELRAQT